MLSQSKIWLKVKTASPLIGYVAIMIIATIFFTKYVDQEQLQTTVKNFGVFGVILYIVFETIYVIFTPFYNTAIHIVSGYIFGSVLGTIVNFIATTAALLLIILIVKKYGRPILQKIISEKYYNRFDSLTQKIGPILLLIIYVIPFTPDDEFTYIIAAGPIGIKRYILPIIFGTIAKSTMAFIGGQGSSGLAISGYARVVMLVTGLIVVGAQEYIIRKRKLSSQF